MQGDPGNGVVQVRESSNRKDVARYFLSLLFDSQGPLFQGAFSGRENPEKLLADPRCKQADQRLIRLDHPVGGFPIDACLLIRKIGKDDVSRTDLDVSLADLLGVVERVAVEKRPDCLSTDALHRELEGGVLERGVVTGEIGLLRNPVAQRARLFILADLLLLRINGVEILLTDISVSARIATGYQAVNPPNLRAGQLIWQTSSRQPQRRGIMALHRNVVFIVMLLAAGGSFGSSVTNWQDKVQPSVLAAATAGSVPFLIFMKEKADLSGAANLRTKVERGYWVYDQLNRVADRSQQEILAILDSQGVAYQRFWAANMILAGGSVDLVKSLASREDVKR